jgi:hypothetical protein
MFYLFNNAFIFSTDFANCSICQSYSYESISLKQRHGPQLHYNKLLMQYLQYYLVFAEVKDRHYKIG